MIARTMEFPRIRACLFDMDGLLIDSEDIYTHCNNIILHKHNKPSLPWKIKAQLQGRPAPEAAEIFHAWAQLPLSRPDFAAQQSSLQAQHFPTTQPLPGVALLLKRLKTSPSNVHLALATSSHAKNFALKSSHLDHLFSVFPTDRRVLGDDPRIPKGRGKPCPDIYLLALETINKGLRESGAEEVMPEECLVFEDSVLGVEAGRRAGMRAVWCPHPELLKEYRGREREVLAGIANGIAVDEEVEGVMDGAGVEEEGVGPGRLDDGWAVLVESLEAFDYGRHGIEVRK